MCPINTMDGNFLSQINFCNVNDCLICVFVILFIRSMRKKTNPSWILFMTIYGFVNFDKLFFSGIPNLILILLFLFFFFFFFLFLVNFVFLKFFIDELNGFTDFFQLPSVFNLCAFSREREFVNFIDFWL